MYGRQGAREAQQRDLVDLERVVEILDELEKRMTFLYRENGSAVSWAYPMTSEVTPHLIIFEGGGQVHAA